MKRAREGADSSLQALPAPPHALPTRVQHPPPVRGLAGTYILASEAILTVHHAAVSCTEELFNNLWEQQPSAVPNPRDPTTNIRRRQGTYGASYTFGGQSSPCLGDLDTAPELVRLCHADAQRRADKDAVMYTGVHVNWYADGKAGLGVHQDTETASLVGHKIFSYSFLVRDDGDGDAYRYFVVSRDKKQEEKVACLPTRHGDLVIMEGARFQTDLWHGVPTTARKDTQYVRRINVTVRAWGGDAAVSDT